MKKSGLFIYILLFIILLCSCSNANFTTDYNLTMGKISLSKIVCIEGFGGVIATKKGNIIHQEMKEKIKICSNPVYIETYTYSNGDAGYESEETVIVEEHDGNIYEYNEYSKKLLNSKEDYLKENSVGTFIRAKDLGLKLSKIKKTGEKKYTLSGDPDKIVNKEVGLGNLVYNTEKNYKLEINIGFTENTIKINMEHIYIIDAAQYRMNYTMVIKEGDPKELDWFEIVPTYSLRNCKIISLEDYIEFDGYAYKLELKKGVYGLIDIINNDNIEIEFNIYDEAGKYVSNHRFVLTDGNLRFSVPNDGIYYIKTTNNNMKLRFEKLDYY